MDKIYIRINSKTGMVYLENTIIGRDMENLQQELIFSFEKEFVSGSARLEYKTGNEKYHIPMTRNGESYTVPIKNVLTKEGRVEMQLVIVQIAQDEEIPVFKSNVFYMYCNKSINAQEEAPDDYEYWLDVIEEKIAEMDEALTEVDNLDIDASKSGDTATISITNKEGTTKSVQVKDGIDGQQGETGPANTLSIGTVIKGENASATITGESPNQTLNLVLPKGDKGEKGEKGNTGNDGYSPSASVTQLSGGATITITDKTGTTTATITSGEQGPTGPAGKDGKDGKDGTNGTNATINGVSTLTLTAGTNISLDQQGSTLTINATGGSGGSSDYSDLTNKPKINNVELNGNKTSSDLGIQNKITSSNKLLSDLVDDTNQTNKFVTENEKTTWNTEIENLHEEDDLLKRNLQTTIGSGEEVTLEKTTELDFVKPPLPMGNSEQESTTGKNLLNVSLLPITSHGITISKDDSGNIVLNGTPDYNSGYEGFILGNTQTIDAGTYTVSVANKKEGIGLTIGGFKGQINLTMSDTVKTKTGTTNESVSLQPTLNIRYDVGTLNNFILNPQLEQSSTATSYEPYTNGASPNPDYPQEITNVTGDVEVTISNENNTESKTLPVSLGNIELCKIGDYQDYLYKNNGKWYKHNAINKLVLNGTEGWSVSNNVFYLTSISDYINSSGKICLSDKYTAINNTSVGTTAITQNNSICFFTTNTNPRLYIRDERFNNVNAFKAELSENNVKVYYPTATPIDTEITDATLISQLEEISKTLSYQGQTNITSNTIAMFDVEAYQDLKIILTDYVKNTDYATSSVGGVVIVKNGDHGITVDEGVLKGTVRTLAQYNDMSSKGIVCKGTLENVLTDRIGDIETALGGI